VQLGRHYLNATITADPTAQRATILAGISRIPDDIGAIIAQTGAFDKVNRAPRAQQTNSRPSKCCAEVLKRAAPPASGRTTAVVVC
jgi:hypothetical protein